MPPEISWMQTVQRLTGASTRASGSLRALARQAGFLTAAINENGYPVVQPGFAILDEVQQLTNQTEVGNPNTEQEGESSMPEAVSISMPTAIRSQLFDTLNARNQLMTNLDMENWQSVLTELQGHLTPINAEIQRGSFTVESNLRSSHPILGRIYVEYVLLEEAKQIIEIASNGKMRLEVTDPDAEFPSYYKLVPIHAIDAEAFLRYTGNEGSSLSYREGNLPHVYVGDLSVTMRRYTEYLPRRATRIRAVLRERMASSQNVVTTPELSAVQKQTRNTNLFNFLENVKKSTKVAEAPFQKIALLPHKTLSSRRWGIEIEAVDIYDIETPEHWDLHSDGSLRTENNFESGFEDEDPGHDEECDSYDGYDCTCNYGNESMTSRNTGGERPQRTGEWNSPILHSFHSRGLKHLCDELEGRYSNSSAGVHVHVEASDLTADQAVKLSMIYTALEPLFESEYYRTERNYCKTVDLSEMVTRLETAKKMKGKPITQFTSNRRYYTVNLAALSSHGTVEFRAMGPIYKYEHLIRWAAFCREMVNIAKANIPQKAWTRVKTFDDVIVMFSKYGKETPTPVWAEDAKIDFDPIVAALGTENRRNPNARPSNAYSSGYGEAPVELFDDYTSKLAKTTGIKAQNALRY